MSSDNNVFKILDEEILHSPSPRWSVRKVRVQTPSGTERDYVIKVKEPFVMVLAVQDGKFLCVEQYRVTMRERSLEFVAGGIDVGEEPLATAQRELKEETGYEAQSFQRLGHFFDANGSCRLEGHVFLAEGLTFVGEDKDEYEEDLETRWVPIQEFEEMMRSGSIKDAKSIAAYTYWKLSQQ